MNAIVKIRETADGKGNVYEFDPELVKALAEALRVEILRCAYCGSDDDVKAICSTCLTVIAI